jgi:hypothetical protein
VRTGPPASLAGEHAHWQHTVLIARVHLRLRAISGDDAHGFGVCTGCGEGGQGSSTVRRAGQGCRRAARAWLSWADGRERTLLLVQTFWGCWDVGSKPVREKGSFIRNAKHAKGQSLAVYYTSLVHCNDGPTVPCRVRSSIDRPFIVLTETKPSKRHIPVWARYSPLRTRVEAHANTFSP